MISRSEKKTRHDSLVSVLEANRTEGSEGGMLSLSTEEKHGNMYMQTRLKEPGTDDQHANLPTTYF